VTEGFLQGMSEQLGNTITEVTAAGPKELAISRKSQMGLTGFELVHLARWMADSSASLVTARQGSQSPAPAPAPVPGPGQP
jgi:hypothetical protein